MAPQVGSFVASSFRGAIVQCYTLMLFSVTIRKFRGALVDLDIGNGIRVVIISCV